MTAAMLLNFDVYGFFDADIMVFVLFIFSLIFSFCDAQNQKTINSNSFNFSLNIKLDSLKSLTALLRKHNTTQITLQELQ